MIIDHLMFSVGDYERSKAFFSQALAPLGIEMLMEVKGWAGFGKNGKPELWLGARGEKQKPMHIALLADNRAQVRDFHQAALAAGAKDNGPPGIRAAYHPHYYGAFVIDPDGHNLEAACHQPEDQA